jgi:hypothetical protein
MFHCHILEHEDRGMMGQFVVVEEGGRPNVARRLACPIPKEQSERGNEVEGVPPPG